MGNGQYLTVYHERPFGFNTSLILPFMSALLGHPQVFNITKTFHNILQGVADPDKDLEPNHKRYFESWIQTNYNNFWLPNDDDLFADRIIVIDDPQLTALIPLIKRSRPDAKIIFRSHIQIQSHLTDTPGTPQAHVWDYIFDFVKQTDLFIAHPVEQFVPQVVKDSMPVLYMPPSTDPLDGLNKPLGREAIRHLREAYNHISDQQCQVTVDWKRGYIVQVARFDPSKGIPDLLAAYLDFRERLESAGLGKDKHDKKPPMLIVVGHGSVRSTLPSSFRSLANSFIIIRLTTPMAPGFTKPRIL